MNISNSQNLITPLLPISGHTQYAKWADIPLQKTQWGKPVQKAT